MSKGVVTKRQRKTKFIQAVSGKRQEGEVVEAATARLLEAKPPEGASRQVRRNFERSQAKVRAAIAREREQRK